MLILYSPGPKSNMEKSGLQKGTLCAKMAPNLWGSNRPALRRGEYGRHHGALRPVIFEMMRLKDSLRSCCP